MMSVMNKLIILGPSAGGKSTLMRYLREHTDLHVMEMDEEIVELNDGKWPTDDEYRNTVLVPKITKKIIAKDKVVYLSSYVPDDLAKEAKEKGFKILLLDVGLEQLKKRDDKRIKEEKYESVAGYFDVQLKGFERLKKKELIDTVIDGHRPTEQIAEHIVKLANKNA